MNSTMERRLQASRIELRASNGQPTRLAGYAALFDSPSEDLGGFTETIKRGAFKDALASAGLDCRMLFNHDSNMVLGRTPDTLALREDSTGLYLDCMPPDTSYAKDVMTLVSKNIVNQCSFGFTVAADEWYNSAGELVSRWSGVKRVITKIGTLMDTSVVTYPAYSSTSVTARSAFLFPGGVPTLSLEDARREAQRSLARKFLEQSRSRVTCR